MWKRKLLLQKQPNDWSCLPTAFAIATGLSISKIIETIGHDGSEIIFPDLEEPFCRRNFHIQELYDVCFLHSFFVMAIEKGPVSYVDSTHMYNVPVYSERMSYYLDNGIGVLTGIGYSGKPHAVAWDGREVFDPNGKRYSLTHFAVDTFFLIVKFNIPN